MVDRLARRGNDRAVIFPKMRLTHTDRNAPELPGTRDFSFSGLKTSVLRHVTARRAALSVVALDGDFYPQKLIRGVEHMSALVLAQLKQVLDAYAGRDLQSALAVWNGDEEVDSMCVSLFRELLTYMMEDPRNITFCMHLMFCAKDIERMGDHATNIAETVYYMIEGRTITDQRPKGDTTSFPAGVLQK